MGPWVIPAAIAGGAALGQIGSGLIGQSAAGEASDKAMGRAGTMTGYAINTLEGMPTLDLPEFYYTPEEYAYYEGATPLQYLAPEEVAASTIAEDPATRQMQMDALQDLLSRSEEGLTAQDRYNFMVNRRAADEAAQGREQALRESMARRGMGGTGLEAALMQQAGQAGTERLAQTQAAQAAANAQARINALNSLISGAGGVRAADIGKERSNAEILNSMAKWNSERQRLIDNMNIEQANRLAGENVAEQRKIAAMNTQQANQAALQKAQYRIDKARQEQQSKIDKARTMAGAYLGTLPATYAQGAADSKSQQQLWGTIGQAFPTAANIYLSSQGTGGQSSGQVAPGQYRPYTGTNSPMPSQSAQWQNNPYS